MGEVGHGAAVGGAVFCEELGLDEERGDDAGEHEEDAHDDGSGHEELAGVADALADVVAGDEGHDGDTGFEAGEAEGELWEEQE